MDQKIFRSFQPYLPVEAVKAVSDAVEDGSISGNFGKDLKELENIYSGLHQDFHSVTASSGTAALHLSMLGLSISKGSTVVVPAITNMASFFAPMYQGAKVISCDTNPNDGLIDFDDLESICQTTRVDCVVVVHLYGQTVPTQPLKRLQSKYGFVVVEDCAEAHFALNDNGNFVGSEFDAGCFSFYANKIISGGEGGICLFKNKQAAVKAQNYKNLSFGTADDLSKFYHSFIGYNYRMSNIQAALVNFAVSKRDYLLTERSRLATYYDSILKSKPYTDSLFRLGSNYKVDWVYCLPLKSSYVDSFQGKRFLLSALESVGIEARDCFYPADHQPFFKKYCRENNYPVQSPTRNSLLFYSKLIYLPLYVGLSESDIDSIVSRLDIVLGAN